MEEFRKIDLDSPDLKNLKTSTNPTPQTMPMRKRRKIPLPHSKVLGIILGVLVVFFVISIFTIILPAGKLYKSIQKTQAQAKAAGAALKQQNIDLASQELEKTRADLTETKKALDGFSILKFIPIGSWYYNDGQHLVSAGFHGLDAGNILIDSVKPYADVLGLKGKGSFVGGSAEQRIQTAVKTMGKITPRIDDIAKQLTLVREDIDQVNPSHYPSFLGGKKIKDQLASAKTLTDEADTFVSQARPLIKILPELLGEPNDKKYLVIFQNDKELRPTGGFITAYAVFRIEHGVIHVEKSSDIYELDATIPNKPKAPKPLIQYLANYQRDPRMNIRDTNLSPDFVTSMNTFSDMYKSAPGASKVDGIIAIDTQALVSAMNILGDITVDGETFTTKTVPACNCSDVIYKLEVEIDQPVNYQKINRKGIIGDLMYSIMSKAFSSSPKKYWGKLFQDENDGFIANVARKHILFYLYNQDAQQGIEALKAGGKIVPFDGDYLLINEANFGGAKSNQFITETVTQKYDIASDASISKTVTINYKNPFPPSDCNLERGGLCLNATLRDWLRIYVPKGSEIVSSQGSQIKVTSYEEFGKTVFDGFLEVRPQGTASFTITYKLPFKAANGTLPLLIQKQPGTSNNDYTITVNGSTYKKFPLLSDTEEKIKF